MVFNWNIILSDNKIAIELFINNILIKTDEILINEFKNNWDNIGVTYNDAIGLNIELSGEDLISANALNSNNGISEWDTYWSSKIETDKTYHGYIFNKVEYPEYFI